MRIAADANVLLATVLGGRARFVFQSDKIEEILTAEVTFAEVEEYTSILARRKRLSSDVVLLALAAMPVTIVRGDEYAGSLQEARKRIGRRDPDDVDPLAVALHFRIPLWSNDKDFEGTGIRLITTEGMLRYLKMI